MVTPEQCLVWLQHVSCSLGHQALLLQQFMSGASLLSQQIHGKMLFGGFPSYHIYGWDLCEGDRRQLLDKIRFIHAPLTQYFSPRNHPWTRATRFEQTPWSEHGCNRLQVWLGLLITLLLLISGTASGSRFLVARRCPRTLL